MIVGQCCGRHGLSVTQRVSRPSQVNDQSTLSKSVSTKDGRGRLTLE
jgi:hypothetical protein